MKKNYHMDVVVIEKKILRVEFSTDKKPTRASVLRMLNNIDYHDITEEETLEYLEVLELGDNK